mmetsp:Transcript_4320/g.15232  ORF Transcript_4320/g.15232 Transcript_4320/m.15232 type:complete len:220 (-) Transcript_4320:8-667(-)
MSSSNSAFRGKTFHKPSGLADGTESSARRTNNERRPPSARSTYSKVLDFIQVEQSNPAAARKIKAAFGTPAISAIATTPAISQNKVATQRQHRTMNTAAAAAGPHKSRTTRIMPLCAWTPTRPARSWKRTMKGRHAIWNFTDARPNVAPADAYVTTAAMSVFVRPARIPGTNDATRPSLEAVRFEASPCAPGASPSRGAAPRRSGSSSSMYRRRRPSEF